MEEGDMACEMTETLWERVVSFNDAHFPGWRTRQPLVYWSNAIAGEAGELCNKVKHQIGGGTKATLTSDGELVEELVDLFIYIVLTSENIGYSENDFRKAFELKMHENLERMQTRGR